MTSNDLDKLKPILPDLVRYYYEDAGNGCGGTLHIVLDDGNTEFDHIEYCRKECEENGDSLGQLICDILFCFTDEERELLYQSDWEISNNQT